MKGLAFLVIGIAIGFVSAAAVFRADEERKRNPDALVDDIQKRFDSLEIEAHQN